MLQTSNISPGFRRGETRPSICNLARHRHPGRCVQRPGADLQEGRLKVSGTVMPKSRAHGASAVQLVLERLGGRETKLL